MRAASWKAIRIPESTREWRSWHAPIMPDSTTVATVFPPAASAASRTFSCLFSPTRFHEDPFLFLAFHHAKRWGWAGSMGAWVLWFALFMGGIWVAEWCWKPYRETQERLRHEQTETLSAIVGSAREEVST